MCSGWLVHTHTLLQKRRRRKHCIFPCTLMPMNENCAILSVWLTNVWISYPFHSYHRPLSFCSYENSISWFVVLCYVTPLYAHSCTATHHKSANKATATTILYTHTQDRARKEGIKWNKKPNWIWIYTLWRMTTLYSIHANIFHVSCTECSLNGLDRIFWKASRQFYMCRWSE